MAILQISRIQHRRGLQQDLPQLASAEFGWSVDQQRLFIGNGTLEEGAPALGVTEILTQHSDVVGLLEIYTFKGLSSGREIVTGVDILNPVFRTLQDRLDDIVFVKNFGAVGDGVTDDTAAIQRALDNTYAAGGDVLARYHHRKIIFPAGKYLITDTLNIPPYILIQGEGKQTTQIVGSMTDRPLAQFTDAAGNTGAAFTTESGYSDYHVTDISFINEAATYNQNCLVIDGGNTATFNRVMFRGGTDALTGSAAYTTDRGTGVAAVSINNASTTVGVKNIAFNQCDFVNHNYGIEINRNVRSVSVIDCFFDHLYHGVVVGGITGGELPRGISLSNNYYLNIAAEAVKTLPGVHNVMSLGNWFESVGQGTDPAGPVQTPAISFGDKHNYSIADGFNRDDSDLLLFPNVELNGTESFVWTQGLGIQNGRQVLGQGVTVTLADSATLADAGLKYIPDNYKNLTIEYTLQHNNQQRQGILKVTHFSGTDYVWSDDYSETGTTNVQFAVDTATGNVQYRSSNLGSDVIMTYSVKHFDV